MYRATTAAANSANEYGTRMASEIERKYLVHRAAWRPSAPGVLYRQGYLTSSAERSVRVRIAGDRAFLTVKGAQRGVTRLEFEYPVPLDDAASMLEQLCDHALIEKTRYREEYAGHTWEIDEFHGDNAGLLIAEIELASENEPFDLPPWAARDVSDDPRYLNSNLWLNPYKNWKT
jgi:adenylate cyclase